MAASSGRYFITARLRLARSGGSNCNVFGEMTAAAAAARREIEGFWVFGRR